jgi:hypothetical protein
MQRFSRRSPARCRAYLLKPGLLGFIVVLPLLLVWLGQARRAGPVFGAALLPFLLLGGWRLANVGDFNIVSFGGFQMSGMAALMLTPAIAERLPAELRAEADGIIARRDGLVASGKALPIPLNAAGSFVSVAAGYFDVLARTHDDVLYGAVAPTREAGESWVAFNVRLQRLALAVIRAAPVSYAAWMIGATTRLVGRMAVVNLGMVLGCLAWLALSRRARPPGHDVDMGVLAGVTVAWTFGVGLPLVLTTFPAARYADSAGMLLPAWPFYFALRRARLPR